MFTRGQIEWAIAQVIGRTEGPGGEPRHDLKMKLKRLLDIDRKKGIDAAKAWPEFRRFAFLKGGLPGKGFAISYTRYDAFALLLGLHLLDSNVPQMAVIRLLRLIRLELRAGASANLAPFAASAWRRAMPTSRTEIKVGVLAEDPQNMVFLVLPSGAGADLLYRRKQVQDRAGQHRRLAGRAGRRRCLPHACLAAGPGVRADQSGPSARLVARTRSPDPSRTSLN